MASGWFKLMVQIDGLMIMVGGEALNWMADAGGE